MKNSFDLTVLRYFVKIAETESFTQASKELFISQPSLSRHIKELEKSLNTTLFRRTKTAVLLTAEGSLFYKRSKKMLELYDSFIADIYKHDAEQIVGSLRIGYQRPAKNIMRSINRRFIRSSPIVTLSCKMLSTDNPIDLLLSKEMDCIYIYCGELTRLNSSLYTMLPVSQHRFGVLCSTANPIAAKDSVSMADLAEEQFILPKRSISPAKYDEIYEACQNAGFTPAAINSFEDIENIVTYVVTYNAISVLPETAYDLANTENITFKPIANYPHSYEICLASLVGSMSLPLLAYFKAAKDIVSTSAE